MRIFSFLIFMFFYSVLLAQGEANYWYFGNNAGLNFGSGSAVAITDGALSTNEGCSTISDADGNLLFYTDGIIVWDRNHSIMPNGTGLLGNPSSTQSAIIVPKPNNEDIYYIFTVTELGLFEGLRYSEVDLSQNSGNGVVTANKNISLFTPCTEKITAIQHANGLDYWVVAHEWNSNNFLTYKVTESGVVMTPTVTSIGSLHDGNLAETIGYMKFSPDGQKLAIAKWYDTTFVEIFDFDSNSGAITNPIYLSSMFQNGPNNGVYGIEFSPNSELMYVSDTNFNTLTFKVHQFNIALGNQADISNSNEILYDGGDIIAAIQLGIDEKIYLANASSGFLDVIENPNEIGAASNYSNRGLFLEGRSASLGLPPFIQSFFQVGINVEFTCLGDETVFSVNSSQTITNIEWDFGDGNMSNLENPTHIYATAGTYTITVSVQSDEGTSRQITTDVTIHDVPIANNVIDYHLCDDVSNDGIETFDLLIKNPEVLGTQSDAVFNILYFSSMDDAVNHENELPFSYPNMVNNETVFVKIFNTENLDCYDITSFDLIVDKQPMANPVENLEICDDMSNDNIEIVDLSQFNEQVLDDQLETDFTITYHASSQNALDGVDPLNDNFETINNPQLIYVRIENNQNQLCFDTGVIEIIIDEFIIAHQPDDMHLCDNLNDGEELFDLLSQNDQVSNGQSGSFNISYHLSQGEAIDNANALTSPFPNTENPQEIFVRIENTENENCYDISSFELILDDMPVANPVADFVICDDASNDETEIVNLLQFNNEILNGQSDMTFEISYHISLDHAINGSDPLPDNFQTIENPQTIFVRIENRTNVTCFETGSFQIIIDDYLMAFQPDDMFLCDEFNDGEEIFDLSLQNDQIANGQSGNFQITYHLTDEDANLNENQLNTFYSNEENPQLIYARIENIDNFNCYNTTSFFIEVLETPDPAMATTYNYCTNETVVLDAGSGFDTYLWSTGETTSSIQVGSAGNYDVTVTYEYPSIPFACSFTETIEVIESDEAVIQEIEIEDWTAENNTITIDASGIGDYEYSIDGINYQDSNVFNNLPVGEYTVYVRDKNGCGIVNEDVYILYYPKVFTPNGDGDNDNWQVYFSETEPDITVLIFDRYGKLLKQLNALNGGWDGTFNGQNMPTSDYWFIVNRPQKGKQYTSHFTLKR